MCIRDSLNAELAAIKRPPVASFATVTDSLFLARSLFPGKKNSLDALCDRLGVDNSSRTMHGALLDAQLLAEVYLALTRGQESLGMDFGETSASIAALGSLSPIRAFQASAEESAAHVAYLEGIAKKAKVLWQAG
jgi:DNA polymerase-3 subunit epsilon